MTSPTDTAKRLSDAEITVIRDTYKFLDEKYPDQICQCGNPDCGECSVKKLLSHIAAISAPPSQGKVERAREMLAAHVGEPIEPCHLGDGAFVSAEKAVAALSAALTEPAQGTSVEGIPSWSDLKFDQRRDISVLLTQTAGARTRYENLRGYLRASKSTKHEGDGE